MLNWHSKFRKKNYFRLLYTYFTRFDSKVLLGFSPNPGGLKVISGRIAYISVKK